MPIWMQPSRASAVTKPEGPIRLDLNNPVFQEQLLTLQKAERHAALDTLNKIRQLTWNQLYRDTGIKWEKITSAVHAGQRRIARVSTCGYSQLPLITTRPTGKNDSCDPSSSLLYTQGGDPRARPRNTSNERLAAMAP